MQCWHDCKCPASMIGMLLLGTHSGIVDGGGVLVELVINDDVKSIAGKIANDVQEAGIHAIIWDVGVALAIWVPLRRSSLPNTGHCQTQL